MESVSGESGQYHQREFSVNNLVFFSNFDSGNLASVNKFGQFNYELFIAPDAYAKGHNNYRVWFYFGVRGLLKGQSIRFTIINMSPVRSLASSTYRPVYRELPKNPVWQRVPTEARYEAGFNNHYRLIWSFTASQSDQSVYFAYAPPYSYQEIMDIVESIDLARPHDIYYYNQILTYSPESKPIHLLTITHFDNIRLVREDNFPFLFPDDSKPRAFKVKKPIVLLTARVHPGETPASFFLEAFLRILLSTDPRAETLRKNFVFKIVPILNPDGVYNGHYRVDQFGHNLNRSYLNPSPEKEPSIYAIKTYAEYIHFSQNGLFLYMDIHAQSSKRSCWLFGNSLNIDSQVQNQLFAKLMSINSSYFDYNDCDFSERSMQTKDPKDHQSKQGCGRVAIHKRTALIHSYTLECPYYCPQPLFKLTPFVPVNKRAKKVLGSFTEAMLKGVSAYNRSMYKDLAQGFVLALLDMNYINSYTRILSTAYKSLDDIRENIRSKILMNNRLQKFRHPGRPKIDILQRIKARTSTPIRRFR